MFIRKCVSVYHIKQGNIMMISLQNLYLIGYRNQKGIKLFLLITNLTHFFQCTLFIYFPSLRVSSNPVLIIRRIEFYHYIIWYKSLCVGDCLVCPTHQLPLPPRYTPGTRFCRRQSRPQGHKVAGTIKSVTTTGID
jgi:hypothetical protein